MKKLTTLVHKFIDVECSEMPEGFETKLRENELFTYRDMVLKEHIYGIETIREKMLEELLFFTTEEKEMIETLTDTSNKEDVGYFRFVS